MRLFLSDISVSFGENEVLKNINFEVSSNDKIALIGRNGCGKTTLLRVITGEQEIDADYKHNIKDKIQKTGKFEIGYLKQIAFEDESETFENEILKVYSEVIKFKEKLERIEKSMVFGENSKDVLNYEDMLLKFDLMGGYTYLKEYNIAIKKFGFEEKDKNKPLSEFSGGQRTKIALLKLLLSKPDLLILDEPTNHLDITSIEWLEDFLKNYNKAIIVVSHDRAFLDKFVNVVYEIERGLIKKYIGNYTQFAKTKELNYEKELKEYKAKIQERDRLQGLADRFRYKATKASMAQSKLKQIERMGKIEEVQSANTRTFISNIQPKVESGNDVIMADNIEIGYDKVLAKLSFKIIKGDKIGVVGGNGLGKSTLLKSLVGKIPLLKGKVKFGTNVEIGYFDQQIVTNIKSNQTVIENFLESFPQEDNQSARNILGSFCFTQDEVFKYLSDLSGGERVRLELCKILRRQPNLLILDEPTNHMDIIGKESLEKILEDYKGTIIFVSHDRYFVNKIATGLIVFNEGVCNYYKNTKYSEYLQLIENKNMSTIVVKTLSNDTKHLDNVKITNNYILNKEKAKKESKRKKLEEKISIIEKEIVEIKEVLKTPEVCSDYIKIMEYEKEIEEKNHKIEEFMTDWYSLSDF